MLELAFLSLSGHPYVGNYVVDVTFVCEHSFPFIKLRLSDVHVHFLKCEAYSNNSTFSFKIANLKVS